jgi:ABC-type lipoprotein export system ATPase subunit
LLMVTHDASLASKMPRTFDCSGLIDYKQSTSEKEVTGS